MNYHTLAHASEDHNEIVCVNWCLGNTCNFSCSYCPSFLHDGSVPWIPIDEVLPFVDRVVDHYVDRLGKQMYVEFTGGEVTLFKDFLRLTQALKDRGQWTGIITNGSRTPRFWEQAKDLIDHVCVSYHPEQGDADHMISTINQISDQVDVHVNIMIKPDHDDFEKALRVAERIATETHNITIDLQTLLVDLGSVPYEYQDGQIDRVLALGRELKKTVRERRDRDPWTYRGSMKMIGDGEIIQSPGTFVSERTNNWNGWWCAAGLEQIVIDYNGDIFRGWCKQGGLIGNVRDEEIHFPTTGVVCQTNFCHCNFDIMCTKRKID